MPPEQAAGQVDRVGPPADIYSLGAILYCLLTAGRRCQAASSLDTLRQVLDPEPVPPRQLKPDIPLDLDATIVLKCLDKSPSRRYQSGRELGDELQRFLKGEPIQARPVSALERGRRWCRRNPTIAALSALAGTLAVIVVTASAWLLVGVMARQQRDHGRDPGAGQRAFEIHLDGKRGQP